MRPQPYVLDLKHETVCNELNKGIENKGAIVDNSAMLTLRCDGPDCEEGCVLCDHKSASPPLTRVDISRGPIIKPLSQRLIFCKPHTGGDNASLPRGRLNMPSSSLLSLMSGTDCDELQEH